MNERFGEIKQEIINGINELSSSKAVYEFKKQFLDSKAGKIGLLMKEMKNIAPEERAGFGKGVNELKEWAQQKFAELDEKIRAKELELRYESEKIDVTEPGEEMKSGNLHPITQMRNEIIDVFSGMGFEVFENKEIENDYYNFTALNTPKDHPARDMQDTFYLSPEFLLATQTSAAQIHTMEQKKPPIKILCPGKVFRSDDDATHSPMFHQVEGLVVAEGITMADLKGCLDSFAKQMFGPETKTKFRPHHFPFTEPSAEMDVSCFKCGGKGCSICKGSGWIEILGCGMTHPNVLKVGGIDTEKYTGFAFGMGVERIAMLKYELDDIRLLYENDIRFIKQFR